MGATMILLEVVQKLEFFDEESTIYAEKPWVENSRALVLREPTIGDLPVEAEKLGLNYFLEVAIAREFMHDWEASLNSPPTLQQKCLRLIHYAINDA